MQDLTAISEVASLLLSKEAKWTSDAADALVSAVSGGVSGARKTTKGLYDIIGAGTRGAAEKTKELVPGVGGTVLGAGIRAAPWVVGAGALEQAAGSPISTYAKNKYEIEKAKLRARLAQGRSVWDPSTGRMY